MATKIAGIDISTWQRNVNYANLAKANIQGSPVKFVFIRAAYGCDTDAMFKTHVDGCLKNGLKVGLYVYSTARTPAQAKAEAQNVIKLIKQSGYDGKIEYPIAYDLEANYQAALGQATCTAMCKAFCEEISANNYYPIIYTNLSWCFWSKYINYNELKQYDLWVAAYVGSKTYSPYLKYMAMHQHSVAGNASFDIIGQKSVLGVPGECDINWDFVDLAEKVKKAGKNNIVKASTKTTLPVKAAGIDVSYFQNSIVYNSVKTNAVIEGNKTSFAMVRCSSGTTEDKKFKEHVDGFLKAKIDVGLYHSSTARTVVAAKAEAEYVINLIKKYGYDGKLTYPIAFALSDSVAKSLGQTAATNVVKAFCDTIKSYNYYPMIETSLETLFINKYIKFDTIKEYQIWIVGAGRPGSDLDPYMSMIDMWEHSVAGSEAYDIANIGKISGVTGNCCCNYAYMDFPAEIKALGMNKFINPSIVPAKFKVGDTVKIAKGAVVTWDNGTTTANLNLLKIMGSDPYSNKYKIEAVMPVNEALDIYERTNCKDPYSLTTIYPYTISIKLGTAIYNIQVRQSNLTKA